MPKRAARICTRCGNVHSDPGHVCATCRQQHDRSRQQALDANRPSAAARGYDATWRRLRAWYLAQHPLCVECERAGRVVAAQEVDHVTPISAGGARLDPENLQALCTPCHSRKTFAESRRAAPPPLEGG